MASTGATGLDVITPGAAVAVPSPPGGTGPVSSPAGFGNGCNSGDEEGEASGGTGGRCGKTLGAAAVDSEEGSGVIFGGNRRIGMTGIRVGKTIRAVSCFAAFGSAAACSGRMGSAMRTASFFGSAMGGRGLRLRKIAQTVARCHSLNSDCRAFL